MKPIKKDPTKRGLCIMGSRRTTSVSGRQNSLTTISNKFAIPIVIFIVIRKQTAIKLVCLMRSQQVTTSILDLYNREWMKLKFEELRFSFCFLVFFPDFCCCVFFFLLRLLVFFFLLFLFSLFFYFLFNLTIQIVGQRPCFDSLSNKETAFTSIALSLK